LQKPKRTHSFLWVELKFKAALKIVDISEQQEMAELLLSISISLFGNNYKQTTNHATENKPH